MSELLDTYGSELLIKVICAVIKNWPEYMHRFNLSGYPSPRMISAYVISDN